MKGLVFLYDILFLFCMLLSLNSRSARGLPTCLGLLSFPILPSSHVHTTPHLSSCIVCFCVFLAFVFAHRWLVLTAPLVEPNTRFIHQHRIMRLFTRQYVYFMSIQLSFICLRLYKFLLWSKGLKLEARRSDIRNVHQTLQPHWAGRNLCQTNKLSNAT